MPIHLAAASSSKFSAIGHFRTVRTPLNAANDNAIGVGGSVLSGERLLKAALRHFSKHGLSAAERARDNAEAAFFAGNREEYRWWMAICTALDRRMSAAMAFHRGTDLVDRARGRQKLTPNLTAPLTNR